MNATNVCPSHICCPQWASVPKLLFHSLPSHRAVPAPCPAQEILLCPPLSQKAFWFNKILPSSFTGIASSHIITHSGKDRPCFCHLQFDVFLNLWPKFQWICFLFTLGKIEIFMMLLVTDPYLWYFHKPPKTRALLEIHHNSCKQTISTMLWKFSWSNILQLQGDRLTRWRQHVVFPLRPKEASSWLGLLPCRYTHALTVQWLPHNSFLEGC